MTNKSAIMLPVFENEPPLDFSKAEVRSRVSEALNEVRESVFGETYYPLIAGEKVVTCRKHTRENPSNTRERIGLLYMARTEDVDRAVARIQESARTKQDVFQWMNMRMSERAAYLCRLAEILRARRYFFIALIVHEVGKSIPEADLEVCEAIDFCEYYASCAPFLEELNERLIISPIGERNKSRFVAIGSVPIAVSIQPWNFPLAISVGPSAAALVTGHAVLYKPAEESSVVGYHLAKSFYEAGIPNNVFHFLPGFGEEIGCYLVEHPATRVISFTGSRAVKRQISKSVSEFNNCRINDLPPEEQYEKRVAALEAGGKNALILDTDADLDEAIPGIVASAFGYAGQKCSALDRLYVVDPSGANGSFAKEATRRLKERIESLPIGPPENLKYLLGPLSSKEQFEKASFFSCLAKKEGTVLAEGNVGSAWKVCGYYVPPLLVCGINNDSRLMREEIFGPVLVLVVVSDIEEAIRRVNDTEYALTAGIYSRNPEHIERACTSIRAGNIYVNRSITGSLVGHQPFGGFKASGNSTKAGGWRYLLNFFVDEIACSENTMRRGTPT